MAAAIVDEARTRDPRKALERKRYANRWSGEGLRRSAKLRRGELMPARFGDERMLTRRHLHFVFFPQLRIRVLLRTRRKIGPRGFCLLFI